MSPHTLLLVESHARKKNLQKRVWDLFGHERPDAQSHDDMPVMVEVMDGALMGRTFAMIVVMFDPYEVQRMNPELHVREYMEFLPTKLDIGGMLIYGHERRPYGLNEWWNVKTEGNVWKKNPVKDKS